jgi:hypothetical protein
MVGPLFIDVPLSLIPCCFIIEHFEFKERGWPKAVVQTSLIFEAIIFFVLPVKPS